MGSYVPGALGPPYTFSFMDPPIKVFIMVSDRKGAIWALCDVPIFMLPINLHFKPSGTPRGTPSPPLFEPQLAPQLGFVGVGYLLFPLTPLLPSLPGTRPKIGLLAGGISHYPLGQIGPCKPLLISIGPYFPTYRCDRPFEEPYKAL